MTPADLSPALVCAVFVLASYRITRLVTTDTLWGEVPETIEPDDAPAFRDHGTELRAIVDRRLIADDGEPLGFWRGKLAELIGCLFCCGAWMSALVVWSWQWGEWAQWGLLVAAVAGGQAFIASRFDA